MKTILLADDEANLRTLVRTTLDDPRYKILEAANGPTAVEIARDQRPNLILLDWMMPGLTGIEVMKVLRLDPATANIPIIMLTAKGQEKDRLQAMAIGAEAYLVKPFSPLELLDRVETVLARTDQVVVCPTNSTLAANPDIVRCIDEADPQIAIYAQDLKRVVDSERRKSAELAHANERLKTLNILKTDFLAFVSHELRTPLNALSIVDTFDPEGDPKEQAELIDIMRSGYERLRDFIARGLHYIDWLSIEHVETSAVTDMSGLVRRICAKIPELASPGVNFQTSSTDAACPVRGEESDLAEVMKILIDNALKFSPKEKTIRVDLRCHAGAVVLTVSDRGAGLTPEMARELFRPYTIANVRHHSAGTGLNLAIARAIVAAHSGDIRVESPGPGRGSSFIVELPICPAPPLPSIEEPVLRQGAA